MRDLVDDVKNDKDVSEAFLGGFNYTYHLTYEHNKNVARAMRDELTRLWPSYSGVPLNQLSLKDFTDLQDHYFDKVGYMFYRLRANFITPDDSAEEAARKLEAKKKADRRRKRVQNVS